LKGRLYTNIFLIFLAIIGFLIDYGQIATNLALLSRPSISYLPFAYRVDGIVSSGRSVQGVVSISYGEVTLLVLAILNMYYFMERRRSVKQSSPASTGQVRNNDEETR
jgi:hypothetical protein